MACVYGIEQPCGECRMCEKEERYTLEQIIDAFAKRIITPVKDKRGLNDSHQRPYAVHGVCPDCGREVVLFIRDYRDHYCSTCGQMIE